MPPALVSISASLAWNAPQSSRSAMGAQIASTSPISIVQGWVRVK